MNKTDKKDCIERYSDRLIKYGKTTKSLGWSGGKNSQKLRFESICDIGLKENQTLLDIGCGFGDLYKYLNTNFKNIAYKGLDINDELIKIGRSYHINIDLENIDIIEDKFEYKYDWVVGSGLFNYRLVNQNNFEYIKKMTKRMFEISNKGIAIDFMHHYVDYISNESFYIDPNQMIHYFRTMSDKIILKMDYLKFECMFFIYKK